MKHGKSMRYIHEHDAAMFIFEHARQALSKRIMKRIS
jgi:hypothetical protein